MGKYTFAVVPAPADRFVQFNIQTKIAASNRRFEPPRAARNACRRVEDGTRPFRQHGRKSSRDSKGGCFTGACHRRKYNNDPQRTLQATFSRHPWKINKNHRRRHGTSAVVLSGPTWNSGESTTV